jgi:hypothetical protein
VPKCDCRVRQEEWRLGHREARLAPLVNGVEAVESTALKEGSGLRSTVPRSNAACRLI